MRNRPGDPPRPPARATAARCGERRCMHAPSPPGRSGETKHPRRSPSSQVSSCMIFRTIGSSRTMMGSIRGAWGRTQLWNIPTRRRSVRGRTVRDCFCRCERRSPGIGVINAPADARVADAMGLGVSERSSSARLESGPFRAAPPLHANGRAPRERRRGPNSRSLGPCRIFRQPGGDRRREPTFLQRLPESVSSG